MLGWLTMGLAVAGVLLNNRRLIWCFPVWMVSNALSGGIHIEAGIWSLAARDIVFFVLAIDGWWKWRKGEKDA